MFTLFEELNKIAILGGYFFNLQGLLFRVGVTRKG